MNSRFLISLLLFQSAQAQQPNQSQPRDPASANQASGTAREQNQQLWYRYPATFWNSQALHLGNGFMGASFFGGVDVETIALTEQSIWSGEPGKANGVNPDAKRYLGQIRQAVVNGDISLSDSLTAKYYLGDNKDFGSFTSIGDIIITQSGPKRPYTEYRRELDLQHSLGQVDYKQDGVGYSREYFCSYPNRVLAIKLKADKKDALDLSIAMKIIQKQFTVHTSGNSYIVDGTVDQGVRKFRVKIMAIAYGGKVSHRITS